MLSIVFTTIITVLLPIVTYCVAIVTKGWEEPLAVLAAGTLTIGLLNGRRLQSSVNYVSAQLEGSRWSIGAGDRESLARHALACLLDLPRPLPPLGGFRISSQEALLIATLIERERPHRVVELGSGCSTIIIARQLQRNGMGRLISIDHEARYVEQTRSMLKEYETGTVVDIRHAALMRNSRGVMWYDESVLEDLGKVDLLIIDGPPGNLGPMIRAGALGFFPGRLRPGCIIVVDDANRRDEARLVRSFCREVGARLEMLNHAEKGIAILRLP